MLRCYGIVVACLLTTAGLSQMSGPGADSLQKAINNPSLQDTAKAWLLLQLANAVFTNEPDKAMQYADEALKLSEKQQWDKGISHSWLTKGGVNYLQSKYIAAVDCFLKVLDSKEILHNKILESKTYNNLANVYSELKQHEKSLAYYYKALAVARTAGDKESQLTAMGNIGNIHQMDKKYDSAQLYYKQALDLAEIVGNKRLISTILSTTGALFNARGNYQESIQYSEKSISLARESGNDYTLAPTLNNLGWAYFHLGEYPKAEQFSKESLAVAKKLGVTIWETEAWELLYTLYEKQGLFGKALAAHKSFISLRDSVTGDEKKQEITRMEMQYENDKKQAILQAQHNAAISRQHLIRNVVIGGAGLLLLGGAVVFFSYKRRRDAEFKRQIAENDMKVMRLQMNPHFIFNSLNSIGDYISKNNTVAATDYLSKFAKIMRQALEHSEYKEISFAEEINNLDLYLSMESLRMNHKFTYEIIIDGSIDPENTMVPPMILQPYVENSIWHGIAKKEGPGKIVVQVRKNGDMLQCIVADDGAGFSQTGNPVKKSSGMQITQNRIDILNKLKNSNASVTLSDNHPGTKVELMLPLELRF